MSSKPETVFYTAVHRILPKEVYREKMYNPMRGGTPDCWYSGKKDDLWIEYKYLSEPPKLAKISVRKLLSPLQLDWLNSRWHEGRNVAVVLGTPLGAWIYLDGDWNLVEITASQITALGKTKQEVANFIRRRTMLG